MSDLTRQTRQTQAQQGKTLQQMLTPGAQAALRNALADRIGAERFMQAAVTSFQSNAKLRRCTEDTILGALFTSAQLGLEIGGPRGLAYLVPYGDQATFVLGYRGLIELFYRTGQIVKVSAFLVHEHDTFDERWDPQIGETFDFVKAKGDRGPKVGVVAYAITKLGGPPIWVHYTREQVLKRRPSRWTGGPWETWEDEMWLKTGVKGLGRWVRQSTDDRSLEQAIAADETVQRHIPGIEQPHTQRLPLEITPTPAPRPPAAQAPPQRRPEPAQPAEADQRSQYAAEDAAAWEEQQRLEAEAYLAEQDRIATDAEGDQ